MSRIVLVLCSMFTIWLVAVAYIPVYRSHRLLREICHLHVGASDYLEVERTAGILDMHKNPDVPCSVQECLWRVEVNSGRFPSFWTAQRTTLTAGLRVEANQLVSVSFGFIKVRQPDFIGIQWSESISSIWKLRSPVNIAYRTDSAGRFVVASVNVSPSASEAEKQKYLDFNLNCFWRYQGCKDVFEFLPVLRGDPKLQAQR